MSDSIGGPVGIIIVFTLVFWTLYDIKNELKRANDMYEEDRVCFAEADRD
ncbi:MAG: hypothetical protein WC761_01310 [Candidatus Paceibacterota bacterium]|jgi:hypothetical protein